MVSNEVHRWPSLGCVSGVLCGITPSHQELCGTQGDETSNPVGPAAWGQRLQSGMTVGTHSCLKVLSHTSKAMPFLTLWVSSIQEPEASQKFARG